MSKFKIGDRVRVNSKSKGKQCALGSSGSNSDGWIEFEAKVTKVDGTYISFVGLTGDKGGTCRHFEDCLELIKGEQTMGRRTFRQLKESASINKGAIFQEQCNDGDQPYELITPEHIKFSETDDGNGFTISNRVLVETQPKWFEEVFPLVPEYGNKAELEAFKKFSKGRK